MWGYILAIPALESVRQENHCEFRASTGYSELGHSVAYIARTLYRKQKKGAN